MSLSQMVIDRYSTSNLRYGTTALLKPSGRVSQLVRQQSGIPASLSTDALSIIRRVRADSRDAYRVKTHDRSRPVPCEDD